MSVDIGELIRSEIAEYLVNFRVCLPAKIESYDPDTHLATVQPLIKRRFYGRQKAELLSSISNVPVIHLQSDNGLIRVPISKGSIVTLVFADRSIESWVASNGGAKEPGDTRKHDLNDAYAIPGGYPKLRPWKAVNPDALEIAVKPGTKMTFGNGEEEFLQIAYDAFSSLKDLAGQLSQTLSDLQLETHSTSSPGAPTGVPLNSASYATIKTTVDSISTAVDNELTKLGKIKV